MILKTLRTKVYDPRRLASSLSLRTSQLPLLAILTGNDIVERKRLAKFHGRLVASSDINKVLILFPALTKYIKTKRLGNGGHTVADIIGNVDRIAEDVFQDGAISELLKETIKKLFPCPSNHP